MDNKPGYEELEEKIRNLEEKLEVFQEAENLLRESEKRYRTLTETATDWIWETNLQRIFTYSNSKVRDILGYAPEEIIGRHPYDFMSKDEVKRVGTLDVDSIQELMPFSMVEYDFIHKDGSKIVCEGSRTPIFNEAGKLWGFRGVARDITRRRQTEEKLRESERKRKKELEIKASKLEDANTALRVLLKQREEDKKRLEEIFLSNVKERIAPYIQKLKISNLDDIQINLIGIIEENLDDLVSPFLHKLSSKYSNLTPKEIEIASLVRQGKTTKEIAEILNSTQRAVEFHRHGLRKKLGLNNAKVNLTSHLLSL